MAKFGVRTEADYRIVHPDRYEQQIVDNVEAEVEIEALLEAEQAPDVFQTTDLNHMASLTEKIRRRRSAPSAQPQECEICAKTFAHAASMRRHRMTSHPETIDKVLPCSACDKEFLSMDGLKRHYNLMHDYRAEQKTKTQYQCDSCGKIVESIECLKTHFKLVHNRINWSFKDHSARRVYRSCAVCCKQFKTELSLREHMKIVHKSESAADARTYKCELCERIFYEESVLEVHKKLHGVRVVKDKEAVDWSAKQDSSIKSAAHSQPDDDEMSEDGVPLEIDEDEEEEEEDNDDEDDIGEDQDEEMGGQSTSITHLDDDKPLVVRRVINTALGKRGRGRPRGRPRNSLTGAPRPRRYPKFQCGFCGIPFYEETPLRIHIVDVHKGKSEAAIATPKKRGRPRKHPLPEDTSLAGSSYKPAKGLLERLSDKKARENLEGEVVGEEGMDESEQQHSTFRRSNRLSRRKEPIIDEEIDVEVDTPDLEKQINQSVDDEDKLDAPPPGSNKKLRCSMCSLTFVDSNELGAHIVANHLGDVATVEHD